MTQELKPCPFCKSQRISLITLAYDSGTKKYKYECKECCLESSIHSSKAYVINSWNTRPLEDALKEQLEKAHARIAELEAANEWQPIETAPNDGTEIMVMGVMPKTKKEYIVIAAYDRLGECFMNDLQLVGHDFLTHWQPLPQPPKESE